MIVEYHPNFKKKYSQRISNNKPLVFKYQARLILFIKDSHHPSLRDHGLTGSLHNFRSFSITGDIRVIYEQISEDHVLFYDIGSHNQVY